MSVLVTGGAGFIGSNLVEDLLNSGEDVTVMDNLSTGSLDNLKDLDGCLEVVKADCSDLFELDIHIDAIYHIGIPSSSQIYRRDPFLVGDSINEMIAILELAKKEGCRVVYAASSSVYGDLTPPHQEDMRIRVTDYYTEARLCMERLADLYETFFSVKSVGMRFFSVYGPKERAKGVYANIVTQFLWEIMEGKRPLIYGDGSQTRDFVYVKDVVRALRLAMNSNYHGILNVGTGKSYSFNEVVQVLNEKMNTDLQPEYDENPIRNYVMHTLADTSRAKEVLDFESQFALREGIDELVEHYLRR
ncbi:MAG TPA: GDP-mannose 4,6-dehydratase [Methanothrix sp.]|nr:GDP-mannose 4,6-dehydratase [Methanothrix sp.]HPJ84000.1 GDP-mannose 4,6-dehydratase [Methanothrix sp.]HPR65532.1 GDP-mannose 4,6-dehydratase [Methanothrix sp.]